MTSTRRLAVFAVALTFLPLAGCGSNGTPAAAPTTASPTPATSPSPTPLPDRDGDGISDLNDTYPDDPDNIPTQPPVELTCEMADDEDPNMFTVTADQSGKPDFTGLWASKPVSCEVQDVVVPITDFEKKVHKTSGYDDNDISTLYEICAEVDPDDVYAEAGFAASKNQVPEINAALTLCPKHPYATKWKQAVQRGKAKIAQEKADLALRKQGRLFGTGTFLVGKEIRPGTYFTTDVDDCYWERQNSSGEIIGNNFVISARRVQVTIRSSDYAFHSQGCGEWRPV